MNSDQRLILLPENKVNCDCPNTHQALDAKIQQTTQETPIKIDQKHYPLEKTQQPQWIAIKDLFFCMRIWSTVTVQTNKRCQKSTNKPRYPKHKQIKYHP